MRIASAAMALALLALMPAPAAASCVERVVLFEMLGCPHCASTRAFLEGKNIPFERIDIWQNPEAKAFMVKNFGSPAVPVITNGGKALRGYNEDGLRKLLCLS